MINSKKQMYLIIGVFAVLLVLTTVTYAFFNYTRTGVANTISTGRIYFNSTQNGTLNLTNLFPVASNEVGNDNQIQVRVYGDTTYTGGEEFEISLVSVNNTITSGSTEKEIPINYIATYAATPVATGETPNNIGTSSNDYFNARGNSTAVYKLNATGVVSEGEQVLVGYIPANAGVDGTLTIKAYLNASSIAISDTYDETSPETEINGTTTNWVNGRTVLTTTEWNSLANTPISFKIKAEANEGTWVTAPATPVIPTIDTCPNCYFMYTTNEYNFGTNGSLVSSITANGDTYSRDYNDILLSPLVEFLGFTISNDRIDKAYSCMIIGFGVSDNPVPYCIEAVENESANTQTNKDNITGIFNSVLNPDNEYTCTSTASSTRCSNGGDIVYVCDYDTAGNAYVQCSYYDADDNDCFAIIWKDGNSLESITFGNGWNHDCYAFPTGTFGCYND